MLKCVCDNCNICKARERMRRARVERPEHVRALDRARYRRDRELRLAAAKAYHAEHREQTNETKRAWTERNPEKRRAHVAVGNAIRDGRLVRQPCEECGAEPAQAHHDDYSRPLDVRWLCPAHHGATRAIALPEAA